MITVCYEKDNTVFTFSEKFLVLIFRTFSTYSLRGLSALPPPEDRKPITMSTISNISRTLSSVCSSTTISCCKRIGRRSYISVNCKLLAMYITTINFNYCRYVMKLDSSKANSILPQQYGKS